MKLILKNALGAGTTFFLLIGTVHANDTLDAMIGNAFVLTYEDGSVVTSNYEADGSVTTDTGIEATWTIDGDTLCIQVDGEEIGCKELPPGKSVGDRWEWEDVFGDPAIASIE